MGEQTGIPWCHHTFNSHWGCVKVSPECANCYAERDSIRHGFKIWGPNSERRMLSEHNWNEPIRWDKKAFAAGERRRVFTNSMADVFEDHPQVIAPREQLFRLIDETMYLDWLLLTKRIQNADDMLPDKDWFRNIWLGVTAGTQKTADLWIPQLINLRERFPVLWLSVEPLLEHVQLRRFLPHIDWVIVGGESGPGHRTMAAGWVRDILRTCREFNVPFFFKQWSGFRPKENGCLLDGVEYKDFPRVGGRIYYE
jgi:protein gp37